MLADARRVPADTNLDADLCVIGAGAAGITLALALADDPIRVVILEAGGMTLDPEAQDLYRGRSSGLPYFPLEAARLRYFGGSTNHWGRLCRPFDALDFEPRDWIPFSGWPIRRSDLDPYYGPAGRICGLVSDDFSAESWDRRDALSPLDLGPRTEPRVAQFVDESDRSFAPRHRAAIEGAENIELYLHANVTEIETDATGAAASRLQVATLEGNRFGVTARHYVLAAGGIENPRLLLASNGRQPAGIGNQNDLVGRFFGEHPRFAAGTMAPTSSTLNVGFYEPHSVDGVEIEGYVAIPKSVQREEEMVDVQVFVQPTFTASFEAAQDSEEVGALRDLSRGAIGEFGSNLMTVVEDLTTFREYTIPGAPLPVPYPEIAREALDSPSVVRERLPDLFGEVAAEGYRSVTGSAPLEYATLVTRMDQAPNPDSRVTLSSARDELGMPRVDLDWKLSPIDRHSAERALEILATGFAGSGLGRVREDFDADEPGWPDDLAGGYHHMGTTRMSDDPKLGVVDRDCRIHGVSNLFVAGSSVFTTGGSSTPTLTIVALALRLADHLKGELG